MLMLEESIFGCDVGGYGLGRSITSFLPSLTNVFDSIQPFGMKAHKLFISLYCTCRISYFNVESYSLSPSSALDCTANYCNPFVKLATRPY